MISTRESIHAALFNLAQTITECKTYSRVLKHWSDVSEGDKPALLQAYRGEVAKRTYNMPALWTMRFHWYIYVHSEIADQAPSTLLNPILDAIEAALSVGPGQSGKPQTLGGLVHYAWVEGDIETDEGTLGQQAVAIVPIQVLVPA